ncbi:hypothetical protein D1872_179820 [compost metagenome]
MILARLFSSKRITLKLNMNVRNGRKTPLPFLAACGGKMLHASTPATIEGKEEEIKEFDRVCVLLF